MHNLKKKKITTALKKGYADFKSQSKIKIPCICIKICITINLTNQRLRYLPHLFCHYHILPHYLFQIHCC